MRCAPRVSARRKFLLLHLALFLAMCCCGLFFLHASPTRSCDCSPLARREDHHLHHHHHLHRRHSTAGQEHHVVSEEATTRANTARRPEDLINPRRHPPPVSTKEAATRANTAKRPEDLMDPRRHPPLVFSTKKATAAAEAAEEVVAQFKAFPPDEYLSKYDSFFVPGERVVNPSDPGWLLQPSPCPPDGPALLVVIPSVDGDQGRRRAIRETWASPAYGHSWPGHAGPWARHTVKVE